MSGWDDDDGDDGWDDGPDAGDDWGDAADDFGDDWDGGGDGGGDDASKPKFMIENLFHEANSFKRDEPNVALQKFNECINLRGKVKVMDDDTTRHLFNALEEITKLQCQQRQYQAMQANFKKLLVEASTMTDNECRSAIRNVLNEAGQGAEPKEVTALYNTALNSLKRMGKRMWFDFGMKLCNQQLQWKDYEQAARTLEELHRSCKKPDGTDDTSKGGHLLEIYAVKFRMAQDQGQTFALEELFRKTKGLAADVSDSRVMSVIHECWAKMYASRNQWELAYTEFYTSFKLFQDIGDMRATQAIKYAVVANILSNSDDDPFGQRESSNKKTDPEVVPVVDLRKAFDYDDIRKFEKVLKSSEKTLLTDPFIKSNVGALLLQLRSKVLLKLVQPYHAIKMTFLQKELNASEADVENLVIGMILDGRIKGRLDQIHNVLDLAQPVGDPIHRALTTWADKLGKLREGLAKRAEKNQGRMGEGPARAFGMQSPFGFEEDQGPQMISLLGSQGFF